jgi:hypothetical protein
MTVQELPAPKSAYRIVNPNLLWGIEPKALLPQITTELLRQRGRWGDIQGQLAAELLMTIAKVSGAKIDDLAPEPESQSTGGTARAYGFGHGGLSRNLAAASRRRSININFRFDGV